MALLASELSALSDHDLTILTHEYDGTHEDGHALDKLHVPLALFWVSLKLASTHAHQQIHGTTKRKEREREREKKKKNKKKKIES